MAFLKLSIAAFILLFLYLIKRYTYWKRRGIPTVKRIVPFMGHMLPVLTVKLNYSELLRKMYDEYKDRSMIGFYKMTAPVLLIRDPYLAQIVLQKNFSSFQNTGVKVHPDRDPLMSKNAFFAVGEMWTNSRKRLLSAFTNVKLKMLFEAVNGVCKKFEDYLERRLRAGKYEVELKWLFSKFTGEVVANAGLGVEGFCFEDEPHPAAFDRIGEWLFKSSLKMVLENTVVFTPGLNDILKLRLVPKKVDKFFRDIVGQSLVIRRGESIHRQDFLQSMLDHETGKGQIDEETIVAEALSFYIDGFETSSITLSFVGYHLATHPDVQEKVRQEVASKIDKHGGVLTFEALKEMTYMDQVISESQRCYPAIGFLTRVCTERCELRGSDGLVCQVEPGVEIVICNHGMQLDPEYWPDPEVFDPERFKDKTRATEKLTFLAFGQGPRICAGIKIAQLQMKSCLATLVSKYRLELSERTRLPIEFSSFNFLTEPIGGLWVHVSKL